MTQDALAVLISKSEQNSEECFKAKICELEKLKSFDTYEEIPDDGQTSISSTWVISKKEGSVKARLVARGYEEETQIQTDSPTVSKAGMRILLIIAAAFKWRIETTYY